VGAKGTASLSPCAALNTSAAVDNMPLLRNAAHNVRSQLSCCLVKATRHRQHTSLTQGGQLLVQQHHPSLATPSRDATGSHHRARHTAVTAAGGSSSSSAPLDNPDAPTGRRSRRTRSTHMASGPSSQQDAATAVGIAASLNADLGPPLQARGRRRGVDATGGVSNAPAKQAAQLLSATAGEGAQQPAGFDAAGSTEQLHPGKAGGEGVHKAGRRAARGTKAAGTAAGTTAGTGAASRAGSPSSGSRSGTESSSSSSINTSIVHGPHSGHSQPLPRVLMLHTGGTLGMDAATSFEVRPKPLCCC
jgi:hypothetical protein